MKICRKCKRELDYFFFCKNAQSKDGFRPSCKECEKPIKLNWALNNKEKIYIKNKNWRERNKSKWVEINVINNKKTRHKNLNKKFEHNYRGSISKAMKKNYKSGKTLELLGCTIQEYKNYIESMFVKDMSWNNRGKIWEIDHIIPLSKFDCSDFEEAKKGFHYSNTQVLSKEQHKEKTYSDIKDIVVTRR